MTESRALQTEGRQCLARGTILTELLERSVSLNGVLIPIASVETALARYVDNLVVWNDDPTYRVSLSGSMTLIHYRGRYLALCTQHQFEGYHEPERVSLLDRDGRMCTSSGGVRGMTHTNESDFTQLRAFDFTEPCAAVPALRARFFNLTAFPPTVPSTDVLFLIAAGFPADDQTIRLEEDNAVDLVKRIIVCRLGERKAQSFDDAVLRVHPLSSLKFNPDGMSGGSVFMVLMQHEQPLAYFGGLIIRAGREDVHVLKVGYVHRFLDQIVEEA